MFSIVFVGFFICSISLKSLIDSKSWSKEVETQPLTDFHFLLQVDGVYVSILLQGFQDSNSWFQDRLIFLSALSGGTVSRISIANIYSQQRHILIILFYNFPRNF